MVNKRNQGSSHDSSFKIGVMPDKKQMKNKKGWIRIVEALVAILLIAGFLILLIDNQENGGKDISSKVYMTENAILREVQSNNTFRSYILTITESVEFEYFNDDLKNHITSRVPTYLNCTSKICDFATDNVCDIDSLKKDIYVSSVMIAADLDTYEPKLLKIFCWIDVPQSCQDGTLYGKCSISKPKYCQAGTLIDNCQICGCSNNYECKDGVCVYVEIPPSIGENKKYMPKYSDKEVFLISNKDWKSVLPLVPLTTWTGSEACKKGYGTPDDVCVYPTLIFHEEETGFDADSIIHFMQQYSPDKVTIVGETPQELDNLLITAPELGAGLTEDKINRISVSDYLFHWKSFNEVVYVQDDYETALIASTYASLLNAPLIIEGTALDTASTFQDMKVICVGDVQRTCDEQYALDVGGVPSLGCTLDVDDPRDFAGNRILINSETVTRPGFYLDDVRDYCRIVWGCTGFTEAITADDNVKACRCDEPEFGGCNGLICVNDVSVNDGSERLFSVTCTNCPVDKCESSFCGDETCDANEDCGNCPADCPCSEGYSCSNGKCMLSLQQKYINETGTNKVILVNPTDLTRSAGGSPLEPEKSVGVINEIHSKTSLAAPFLAGAKHEVIISSKSTSYDEIDSDIKREFDNLFGINSNFPVCETGDSCSSDFEETILQEYWRGKYYDKFITAVNFSFDNLKDINYILYLSISNDIILGTSSYSRTYKVSFNEEYVGSVVVGAGTIGFPGEASGSFEIPKETVKEASNISLIKIDYGGGNTFEAKVKLVPAYPLLYMTIIASPVSIPDRHQFSIGSLFWALDQMKYGDFDNDQLEDITVGRLRGFTSSDVSSLVSRTLFFSDLRQNSFLFLAQDLAIGVTYNFDRISSYSTRFNNTGYDSECNIVTDDAQYSSAVCSVDSETSKWPEMWKKRELIYYDDHGSGSYGGISYNQIPYLSSSFVLEAACLTCSTSDRTSFCDNTIRKGALAYVGLVTLGSSYDTCIPLVLENVYFHDFAIGDALKDAYKWGYTVIGDPTLNVNPPYTLGGL